jgi:hypothetical protein
MAPLLEDCHKTNWKTIVTADEVFSISLIHIPANGRLTRTNMILFRARLGAQKSDVGGRAASWQILYCEFPPRGTMNSEYFIKQVF